jgi:hypothetical protein
MWQKSKQGVFKMSNKRIISVLVGLSVVGLLLAACGSSATTAAPNSASNMSVHTSNQSSSSGTTSSSQTGKGSKLAQYGPQYLQKSLQVTMEVQNANQAASDLQQWIGSADPQATSDGTDYQEVGSNQYNVTLTYLVDVDHYTQVESYLRGYAGQKGNTLLSLHESVQDVTNDYVDSQSTLTNLRAEQQRLLGFMNQAQNVNDAVNIEQQLTQVEGQINSIEAHINALKGQTTFYTITISLQPVGSAPPPPAQPGPWSVVPIWQGAWSAVVSVWQLLATLLVWLAAFSVYIVPAALIIWLVRSRMWRWKRLPHIAPAMSAPVPAPVKQSTDDQEE